MALVRILNWMKCSSELRTACVCLCVCVCEEIAKGEVGETVRKSFQLKICMSKRRLYFLFLVVMFYVLESISQKKSL